MLAAAATNTVASSIYYRGVDTAVHVFLLSKLELSILFGKKEEEEKGEIITYNESRRY